MKRLVSTVRQKVHGKSSIGLSIPLWVGLLLGSLADVYSTVTKKQTLISRIRVKKFCSSSSFSSNSEVANAFERPYLSQGLQNTLTASLLARSDVKYSSLSEIVCLDTTVKLPVTSDGYFILRQHTNFSYIPTRYKHFGSTK